MKAYTVYQPYAYATVAGLKHYETRPRRTNIRGRVAVHAGRLDEVHATKSLSNRDFWAVMEAIGGKTDLPRGAVIGTVEIVDCVPVEEIVNTLSERERVLGDYSPGRFAWVIQNQAGGNGRARNEMPGMRIRVNFNIYAERERRKRARRTFCTGSGILQTP